MNPAQKALWYIESHLAEPLTLDEIAAIDGISRFHMVRAFASATGFSVMRYVRVRRLTKAARALAAGALATTLGVAASAPIPKFHSKTGSKRARKIAKAASPAAGTVTPTDATRGKVALFVTCYGDRNEPHLPEDLTAVFEHNGIPVKVVGKEKCCGMPKLELGDLERRRREEPPP